MALKQYFKWFFLFACIYFLTSCKTIQKYSQDTNLQSWSYADVRLLDSIDANDPTEDLIAAYSRINDLSVQLRVDFLKMPIAGEQDFYILFDTNPGGSTKVITGLGQDFVADINWDYLIKIPSKGNVSIYDYHYISVNGMALLIMREPSLESLIINFNKNTLPITLGRTFVQIFITSPGSNRILDKTKGFSIDASSPSVGKVLFAFWNTFSSATPAQALRSWAGAHAGPVSTRHGLKYLLEAAEHARTPIMLADLFSPENLSALDYMGALPEIDSLFETGIILSSYRYMDNKENIEFDFINDNNFVFNRYDNLMGEYDYAQFIEHSQCLELSNQNSNFYQVDEYLSTCKYLIFQNAFDHSTLPLIIGGDFSESLLGDPSISTEFFRYISTHPWIQVISNADINNNMYYLANSSHYSQVNSDDTFTLTTEDQGTPAINTDILVSLALLPKNEITYLAKNIYESLVQPSSEKIFNLRSNYIGQIGFLIKAAEWVNNPANMLNCDSDLDYDGQNECVLANTNIFTVIDPIGGYIPFVFSKNAQGVHQIIGPTWEFLVGISDSSEWDNSKGLRSDPGQILGAFSDSDKDLNKYTVIINDNEMILVDDNMSVRKSISISQDTLLVGIRATIINNNNFYIPLVIDPWTRYYRGWGDLYIGNKSSNSFEWGITSLQMVQISTSKQASFYAFNDTHSMMMQDETPNFDYTRGHYLPFPMSMVEITADNEFTVEINLKP